MKTCNKCGETKPLFEFHKDKLTKDGHKGNCKVCAREITAAWYEANKERKRETDAAWRKNNKERTKEHAAAWRKNNKEHAREYGAAWKKTNKGAVNAAEAKRRAAKLQATTAWADLEEIKQIYNKAAEMNKYCTELGTDIRYHVDHIIPLQNDKVSGLHVPENLQIITSEENLRKNNNFEVN